MMNSPREGRGIALVGYRATGKSTVGRILAHRLGLPFVDTDHEVEVVAGRSIREIFAEDGEPAFRDQEAAVLADLVDRMGESGAVVATGGGTILLEENRRLIRSFGFVAWLTADAEILARRLRSSRQGIIDRPALTPVGTLAEIGDVLEARTPLYREVANAEIPSLGRDAARVAEAVFEAHLRHRSGADR